MHSGWSISRLQLALLGTGLALRLLTFSVMTELRTPLFSDMRYYADVGDKLLRGQALDSYEQYFMPLGLSYLYAFVKLLGADPTVLIPICNIGADMLSCWLVGRLAAILVSPSLLTWALGAACLYPPFILQSSFLLTETLFLFLGLSAYYWYVNAVMYRQHPCLHGILFGISFALAVQFKTNLWLLIPLMLMASLVWKALRCPRTFVVGAIFSLTVLGSLVRPEARAVSLDSMNRAVANASVNLYAGRTYARYIVLFDHEKSQWVHNTPPALFFKKKNEPIIMNHSPLDGWFFIKASSSYVWAHKETVVTYSAEHVLDLLGLVPYWPLVQTELAFLDPFLRLAVACGVILPALLSFGLLLNKRAKVLLGLPLITILLVSIVFFGDPRYRLPYDGYLLILAVTFYSRVLARSWAVWQGAKYACDGSHHERGVSRARRII
jgi:hypothetical protein